MADQELLDLESEKLCVSRSLIFPDGRSDCEKKPEEKSSELKARQKIYARVRLHLRSLADSPARRSVARRLDELDDPLARVLGTLARSLSSLTRQNLKKKHQD